MKKIITIALCLCLLLGMTVDADNTSAYTVDEKIAVLKQLEIINCYEDGSFYPEQNITRAEFAKMVALISGINNEAFDYIANMFSDVPQEHWANRYVNSAILKTS